MLFKYGFRWKKPILMLRLMKHLFLVKVLKQKRLKYIDVAFNYACNLNCEFCFVKNLMNESDKEKMTLEEHKQFCKEAMELGAYHFDLQGGEPLLNYEELKQLIEAYKPSKNFISITTNGILLSKAKVEELKNLGVDLVILSWNSNLLLGLRDCDDAKMNVVVNFVVSHQNVTSIEFKELCFIAKRLGFLVNCLFAVPVGGWKDKESVMLDETDKAFFKFLQEQFPLRRDIEANFGEYGCGAVKESLYLTPYGDVFACPFIHKSLGDVKKESLEQIRNRGLQISCFKDYYPVCIVAEERKVLHEENLLA